MIILSATNPDKAALVKLLKAAKQAYYNTGEFYKAEPAELPPGPLRSILRPTKGVVTDAAYDKLEDALREMDPNHPLLKSVGAAPKKRKIKLAFPMASLDKRKGAAFDPWAEDHPGPYVLSDKIDGISIGVKYESGNRPIHLLLMCRSKQNHDSILCYRQWAAVCTRRNGSGSDNRASCGNSLPV